MMTTKEQTHSRPLYQVRFWIIFFVLCQSYNTGHIQDQQKNDQKKFVPVTNEI